MDNKLITHPHSFSLGQSVTLLACMKELAEIDKQSRWNKPEMIFWLTGVDEPVVQNTFLTHFKMLKKFKQIFWIFM